MRNKRWFKREVIKAVHEDDINQFLSSLGILNSICEGNFHCAICNKLINLDNFGAVYPQNNKIQVICDSLLCLNKITMETVQNND